MKFKSAFQKINGLQLLFDLLIVIIGVYVAFKLSEMQSQAKHMKEGQRVVSLLEIGLKRYHDTFSTFVKYHESNNSRFYNELKAGGVPDFSDTYYPAPQYPIDVIRHILTRESYQVFTIDFYVPLTAFSNAMERLMYIEEKLVKIAEQYEPLPDKTHPDYERIFLIQRQNAIRYYNYLEKRQNTCEELVTKADGLIKKLKLLE